MNLGVRRQKSHVLLNNHVLTVSIILCQVYARYLCHHLGTETRQTGYSMKVCARFGQETGASEGETLERATRRKYPEEILKTFKVGFVSIYISSNWLAKT